MVNVHQSYHRYSERKSQRNFNNLDPSNLFSQSFTSKKLSRKYPILVTFHRATDGALLGFLLILIVMSTIALHAQHLWNLSFSRLETSRQLIQKLRESTSVLESHFLTSSSLSKFMVEPANPKKNLVYIDRPLAESHTVNRGSSDLGLLEKLIYYPVSHGY